MNVIGAGCCIYLREGPPHLWLVLSDPIPPHSEVLTVMLNSVTRHTDATVILVPGDHSFVVRNTAVSYGSAKWRRVSAIVDAMTDGRCELRESLCPEVLARVQDGLFRSIHAVPAIRDRFTPPHKRR
jgi:hypothetical protein